MSEQVIQQIAQAAKIAAPVGQGLANRDAARGAADTYRTQAGQATQSAAYDEARARREGREAVARQAASAIGEGQGDSSAMDVVRQNEVNMIADALAIRARGKMEAAGYESRAKASDYEGDQAFNAGLAGSGAELLRSPYERRQAALRVAG